MSSELRRTEGAPQRADAAPGGPPTRPGVFCRELLDALEASDGRRRRRKRDTTPDAIGLGMKRALLEAAVAADPEPDEFEGWLLMHCLAQGGAAGGLQALALSVLEEWRFAAQVDGFRAWLEQGAPSDDAAPRPDTPAGRGAGKREER